jgi:tetratricopeptide (TPR) repeat protein
MSGKATVSPDELKKILEKQPQDTVVWLRLGGLYEQQNAVGDAAKAYEKALQVNPRLLPAVLRLASINAESLHNNARALELAGSARELAPSDPSVAAAAGHIALNGGNYPWAYSLLQEAARGNADIPVVYYDLAMASYSLGHVKQACEAMQRVTAAPDEQLAANAKNFVKMVMPDGKTPTVPPEEVDATLKANPANVPALMLRAAAEEHGSDSKAAVATYSQILKIYPAFAPAQKAPRRPVPRLTGESRQSIHSGHRGQKNPVG